MVETQRVGLFAIAVAAGTVGGCQSWVVDGGSTDEERTRVASTTSAVEESDERDEGDERDQEPASSEMLAAGVMSGTFDRRTASCSLSSPLNYGPSDLNAFSPQEDIKISKIGNTAQYAPFIIVIDYRPGEGCFFWDWPRATIQNYPHPFSITKVALDGAGQEIIVRTMSTVEPVTGLATFTGPVRIIRQRNKRWYEYDFSNTKQRWFTVDDLDGAAGKEIYTVGEVLPSHGSGFYLNVFTFATKTTRQYDITTATSQGVTKPWRMVTGNASGDPGKEVAVVYQPVPGRSEGMVALVSHYRRRVDWGFTGTAPITSVTFSGEQLLVNGQPVLF
jgi:hypothetical protein